MPVRNESVRLSLEDDFTSGMARAAAAAALFRKEVNDIDGKRVGNDLDGVGKSAEKVGKSARSAGGDLNTFTGRLGLLAEAAITLAPAAVRLGAGALPVLTGSIAGLGAAAGGLGVALLAFQGLGDAVKAASEYNLEPTVDNLHKMQEAAAALGPSGAHFVEYLSGLEPVLRDLQNTARAGMFPGMEAGIDQLLGRLPQARGLIADLSAELGSLAERAGASLAGPDFDNFFAYLETDARPTLDAFSTSLGNVGLGIANMLVAFAPASRDFTGGLEEMTARFAEWTTGLEDNRSFQEFLAYVRDAGPQVAEFTGALAQALAGIAEAAAPLGSVMLPALTGVLDALSSIASSPFGPAIYGGVTALLTLNRVAQGASGVLDRLNVSSERTSTSLGRMSTAGAGIVGVGIAVGQLADNINRIDSENLDRSLTALQNGDVTGTIDKVIDSMAELKSPLNKVDLGEIVTVGGLFGDTSLDKFADNIDQVDQTLARLVESGNADQAAELFRKIGELAEAQGLSPKEVEGFFDAYGVALDNATHDADRFKAGAGQISGYMGEVVDSFVRGAEAAQTFSASLAELNGWFDKRAAVRSYRDSIDELRASLANGFTREDASNIDAIGLNILKVADGLRGTRRANFLEGAREQMVDLAKHAGPQAAAAIQKVIDKFDSKGLTNPPPIKLDAETKRYEAAMAKVQRDRHKMSNEKTEITVEANTAPAIKDFNTVGSRARDLNNYTAKPGVQVDAGNAFSVIGSVKTALANVHDKTVTLTVITNRRGGVTSSAGGRSAPEGPNIATGGHVRGPGTATSDSIPANLSDNEFVMRSAAVDKYGVGLMHSINALNFATGGLVQRTYSARPGDDGAYASQSMANVWHQANAAAGSLKELNAQSRALEKQQNRLERQQNKAEQRANAAQSRYDSISGTVSGGLMSDIFAESQASGGVWGAGSIAGGIVDPLAALGKDITNAQVYNSLFAQLKSRGLSDGALEATASQGLSALQLVAGYSDAQLSQFGTQYDQRAALVGTAAGNVANTLAGSELKAANSHLANVDERLKSVNQNLKQVERAIKQKEKADDRSREKHSKQNAKDTGDKVNGAASAGHRRGKRG